MCDECTWHHKTFLVQSVYLHLAINMYWWGGGGNRGFGKNIYRDIDIHVCQGCISVCVCVCLCVCVCGCVRV